MLPETGVEVSSSLPIIGALLFGLSGLLVSGKKRNKEDEEQCSLSATIRLMKKALCQALCQPQWVDEKLTPREDEIKASTQRERPSFSLFVYGTSNNYQLIHLKMKLEKNTEN